MRHTSTRRRLLLVDDLNVDATLALWKLDLARLILRARGMITWPSPDDVCVRQPHTKHDPCH